MKVCDEKLKQSITEMSFKDDQLLILKTEMQNSQDRLKYKTEEASKLEVDVGNLTQKCQLLAEEVKKLETALERSRDNGERLHKESEQVIANVNTWVNEQR